MNRVGNEIPEKVLKRTPEEEIAETLIILNYYMKKIEEERGDAGRIILMGNPLEMVKPLRYLTENQYLSVKNFLAKYTSSYRLRKLKADIQAEVNLYLGFSYEKGLFGIEKNYRRAFGHYMLSMQFKNATATFRIAQCYEKGIGKERNMKRALYFYRCAAKLGLVDAMHTYGIIILFGDVNYNNELEVGYFYLKLAAKKATNAYPYPLYDLARCYEKGEGPNIIQPDNFYAFKLYSRGAALDRPNCQFRVGKCFENGELGQERDSTRALEWYMKAADLGQSDAQLVLSTLFLSGVKSVFKRNYEMAFLFGLRAATREHTVAAYLLSECYEQGVGVKKNAQLAFWWNKIAEEFQKIHKDPLSVKSKFISSDNSISDDTQPDFEDGIFPDLIKAQ